MGRAGVRADVKTKNRIDAHVNVHVVIRVYAAGADLKIKILPGFRRFPENSAGQGGMKTISKI